jgi:hypothetical protein
MKMSPNYKSLDRKNKILNRNCLNFAMFFEIDGVSMCLPFDFDTPAPLRVGRDKKYRPNGGVLRSAGADRLVPIGAEGRLVPRVEKRLFLSDEAF